MKQYIQPHPIPSIINSQCIDNQILNEVIQSLKVEDFRYLINGLYGKDNHALAAALNIHPQLIYIINGVCRLRESEPFEMFAMNNWYFVYKSKELLFSNGSREIIERIFRQCVYYEELEFQEQKKANSSLTPK
jgi:hypothetical protein